MQQLTEMQTICSNTKKCHLGFQHCVYTQQTPVL